MPGNILKNILDKNLSTISLVLMMELLHSALWFDFGGPLSKSLFLAHFGFFLLWQPIWNHQQRFDIPNTLLFIAFISVLIYWLNLWLILVWLFLIVGFIGGILKYQRNERFIYMVSLLFFVTELLIGCNTQLFHIPIDSTVENAFTHGMFYIPLLILIVPASSTEKSLTVDLLRAISSSLLISMLTLGSLLNMYHTGSDYLLALIQTILAISFGLAVISWLLSPKLGFSGLSQLWSKSLLNIGTPFEVWLNKLYKINQEIESPSEFLESAMQELTSVSWISGIEWKTRYSEGEFGEKSRNSMHIEINRLTVNIFTYLPGGGALYLHARLLVQLIENMFSAKIQEHKLSQQAHLKTVYETGARITHDVKNLLQSLKMLTGVLQQTGSDNSNKDKLLNKQLPNLTHRLQLALDKLQSPEEIEHEYEPISSWCNSLDYRINHDKVRLIVNIEHDASIPSDLFDSIIDNLLENAYIKQQQDSRVEIAVQVQVNVDKVELSIQDTGQKIPEQIASRMFREILPSRNGLGIGLFQAAKQARLNGYELELMHNENGKVEFTLSKLLS